MKKKVVAIFLCTALVLGSTFTAAAEEPINASAPALVESENFANNAEAVDAANKAYNAELEADKAETAANTALEEMAKAQQASSDSKKDAADAETAAKQADKTTQSLETKFNGDATIVNIENAAIEGTIAGATVQTGLIATGVDIKINEELFGTIKESGFYQKTGEIIWDDAAARGGQFGAEYIRNDIAGKLADAPKAGITKEAKQELIDEAEWAQKCADWAKGAADDAQEKLVKAEADLAVMEKAIQDGEKHYNKVIEDADKLVNTEREIAEKAKKDAEKNYKALKECYDNAKAKADKADKDWNDAQKASDNAAIAAGEAATAATNCEDILASFVDDSATYKSLLSNDTKAKGEQTEATIAYNQAKDEHQKQQDIINTANGKIEKAKKDKKAADDAIGTALTGGYEGDITLLNIQIAAAKAARALALSKELREAKDKEIARCEAKIEEIKGKIADAKQTKEDADESIRINEKVISTAQGEQKKIDLKGKEATKKTADEAATQAANELAEVENYIFTPGKNEDLTTKTVKDEKGYDKLANDLKKSNDTYVKQDEATTGFKEAVAKQENSSNWWTYLSNSWNLATKISDNHAKYPIFGEDGTHFTKNNEKNTEILEDLTADAVIDRSLDDVQLSTYEASFSAEQAQQAAKNAEIAAKDAKKTSKEANKHLGNAEKRMLKAEKKLNNMKVSTKTAKDSIKDYDEATKKAQKQYEEAKKAYEFAKFFAADAATAAEKAQQAADEAKNLAKNAKVKKNSNPSNNKGGETEPEDDTQLVVIVPPAPTARRGVRTTVAAEEPEVIEEVIEEESAPKADAPVVEATPAVEEVVEDEPAPLAPMDEVNHAFPWWIIAIIVLVIGTATTVVIIGNKNKEETKNINLK